MMIITRGQCVSDGIVAHAECIAIGAKKIFPLPVEVMDFRMRHALEPLVRHFAGRERGPQPFEEGLQGARVGLLK